MMSLFFVMDGPADYPAIAHLVASIVPSAIDLSSNWFVPWKEIRGHDRGRKGLRGLGGFGRKLLFAIEQAKDIEAAGVVAIVDRDKSPDANVKKLHAARDRHNEKHAPFATALGEAKPHFEAWLLADAVAVRQALGLPEDVEIPSVRNCPSPKDKINDLAAQSTLDDKSASTIRSSIAESVVPDRCIHSKQTGFDAFRKDVQSQIGPLALA